VKETMTAMQVPLSKPWITSEDVAGVLSVLESPVLSLGPRVRQFERAMADYVGVADAVAVNSGTSGLHLCLAALGIEAGDEVVTSPFSFVASANAAIYQGARPVFADIDPQTLTIDPAAIDARISPRTRAILPVDVFGQPAATEAITAIARRCGLAVVRDACEAIGAEREGHRAGSDGTPTVFAFYPNKQMTTGEGGIVVTNDLAFARLVRSMSNQGRDDNGTWMNHVRLGYNYRLDEMSASLGITQLARIEQILSRRAQVAAWYTERLAAVEAVRTPLVAPETTRMSWFVYVIRLAADVDRAALIADLETEGVPTRPYFVPIHLQPYYRERFGYRCGDFPVTEAVARTTLALPFFTEMTEEQVDYVCVRLNSRLRRQPRMEVPNPTRRALAPA
jgi:perosamine synthetase